MSTQFLVLHDQDYASRVRQAIARDVCAMSCVFVPAAEKKPQRRSRRKTKPLPRFHDRQTEVGTYTTVPSMER